MYLAVADVEVDALQGVCLDFVGQKDLGYFLERNQRLRRVVHEISPRI